MSTLVINKKSLKTWLHTDSVLGSFIISKFYFNADGVNFQIVEQGQSKRVIYAVSDITIIDDTDEGAEYGPYGTITELSLQLEVLKYPAFYVDGSFNSITGLIEAGTNVTITGSGTESDPYVINASGGGVTPDLQAVTDVGNETTNIVKFVVDADNYIEIDTANKTIRFYKDGDAIVNINENGISLSDNDPLNIKSIDLNPFQIQGTTPGTSYSLIDGTLQLETPLGTLVIHPEKITINGIDYPLPTGASSQIATLADITASTPDLPTVLAQGNREILKIGDAVETYTTVLADRGKLIWIPTTATVFTDVTIDNIYNVGDTLLIYIDSTFININTIDGYSFLPTYADLITNQNQGDLIQITYLGGENYTYNIIPYEITSGGVTDGDKGDITVGSSGTVWTIDNGVVSNAKVASGIDAVKIGSGNVSNTEFGYLDGVTSNIQTQLNSKQNLLTVFKNTTQTAVAGTTSETIIYAEEVLANTLADNTILSFKSRVARGPRVGTCVLKLYLNTVNNLSGSPVAIAQVTINANIGAQPFVREQIFIKDNVLSVAASSNAVTDVTSGVPIFAISTYNINTTYYWILTAQPNTSTDSLIHNFSILEKN